MIKTKYIILTITFLTLLGCGQSGNLTAFSKRKYLKRSPKQKIEKQYTAKQQQLSNPKEEELTSYNSDINLLASINNLDELLSSLEKELSLADSNEVVNLDNLLPLDYMFDYAKNDSLYTCRWSKTISAEEYNSFINDYNQNKYQYTFPGNTIEEYFYKALIFHRRANNLTKLAEAKIKGRNTNSGSIKYAREHYLRTAINAKNRFINFITTSYPDDYKKSTTSQCQNKYHTTKVPGFNTYIRKDINGGEFDPSIDTAFYKMMYESYFEKYLNQIEFTELPAAVYDSVNTYYDFANLEKTWKEENVVTAEEYKVKQEATAAIRNEEKVKRDKKKNTWETIGAIAAIVIGVLFIGAFLYLVGAITYAAIVHLAAYGVAGGPTAWINFLTFLSLVWMVVLSIGLIIVGIGIFSPETLR